MKGWLNECTKESQELCTVRKAYEEVHGLTVLGAKLSTCTQGTLRPGVPYPRFSDSGAAKNIVQAAYKPPLKNHKLKEILRPNTLLAVFLL